MLVYAARRTAGTVLTLLAVSAVMFVLFELLPGDAASIALSRAGGLSATPETLAALRHEMGLDRTAPERFADWVGGVVRGDLGSSAVSGTPVGELLSGRLSNSLVLAAITTLLLVPLSIGIGLLSGSRPGSRTDRTLSAVVLATQAVPVFVLGTFLVATFALAWGVLPAVSLVPTGTSPLARPEVLVLPVVCLLAGLVPHPARVVRAQTVEVMATEYVKVARRAGVRPVRLLLRHVAPNAVGPAVQPLAGAVAGLVGGIVVVELLFGYPGVSQELLRGISARDLPFVQSVAFLLAAWGLGVYLVADLLALALSPTARRAVGVQ